MPAGKSITGAFANLQKGEDEMANADVRFFEIGGDHCKSGVYTYHVQPALGGGDPKSAIRHVVAAGRLPGGGNTPVRTPGNPDRYLDIVETWNGVCTYAFRLNALVDGRQRLQFVQQPFIALPTGTGEVLLTDFDMSYDATGNWASFSCDTYAVRNSELAGRLRAHPVDESELRHPLVLTIPFTFNVIDPVLGIPPWTVAPETGCVRLASHRSRTHGGVHPSPLTYLVMEI
jgi:hypothetical protein